MAQNINQISARFKYIGKKILDLRWGILIVLFMVNVLAIMGIPKIVLDSSTESWFMADDPILVATDEFKATFGNNHFIGVLVEAEDVFAPEILGVIRDVGRELSDTVPYADDVLSLTDFEFTQGIEDSIDILNIVPDEIPTASSDIEAIRELAFSKPFLVNRLLSDDSREAWIILRLLPYPDEQQPGELAPHEQVAEAVLNVLKQDKYAPYSLKPSGGPILQHEQRADMTNEAVKLIGLAFLIAILFLLFTYRSVMDTLIPLVSCISSILIIFGAMGHLGTKLDTIVVTLPVFLALAISIGYSIHLFNFFYTHFRMTGDRQASVIYAVEQTGWPMFFTSLTTVCALISFFVVRIKLIQWMGIAGAATITLVYLMSMTLMPVLLSFGKNREPQPETATSRKSLIVRLLPRLSTWILGHSTGILILSGILALVFVIGATQIYVAVDYETTYGIQSPFVEKLRYIAGTKIGTMYSYDITLTYTEPGKAKDPKVLKQFEALRKEIEDFPLVKRTSSLLDIVKDLNQVVHNNNPEFSRIPTQQDMVSQLLLLYEMSAGTETERWVDYEYTTLRMMVSAVDFDTAEVEREFHYLEARTRELFPDAKFSMTGSMVLFSVAQNYIVKGEIRSTILALVLICILMILVFRNLKAGLIGVIPNIFPVIVVLGIMGYMQIAVDLLTMMIVPMLLGIAVDDTIHFMVHCQSEFQHCNSYPAAIHNTFIVVGKSIFMTSCILMIAFSVYMTAETNYNTHLGMLVVAGVASALLADYFVTPALIVLTKPFGHDGHVQSPAQESIHLKPDQTLREQKKPIAVVVKL